jgi:hypothetical protein
LKNESRIYLFFNTFFNIIFYFKCYLQKTSEEIRNKKEINQSNGIDKIKQERRNENLFKPYADGFKNAKWMFLLLFILVILRDFIFKKYFEI